MDKLIIKIKDLACRLRKKEDRKSDAKVATTTVLLSEHNKFASLIALATAAQGCDAEHYFPRLFQQDTEDSNATHASRPTCLDTEAYSVQVQQNKAIIPLEMTSADTAVDSNTICAKDITEVIKDEEAIVESALVAPLSLILSSSLFEDIAMDDKTVILSPLQPTAQQEDLITPVPDAVDITVSSTPIPAPPCEEAIISADFQITLVEKEAAPSALSVRDFTIIRKLGSGGFGTVHLVRHNPSGTSAALKVITKGSHTSATASGSVTMGGCDTFSNLTDGTTTEEVERGFETMMRWESTVVELFALQRIAGTPGMLEILGSFHDSENFYYVTPFYPGGDLQSLLEKKVHFNRPEAKFYLSQLLVAIEALHKMGIIHRDLKPANLFINSRGYLVVGDFGLAKTFDKYACEFEKKFDPRYDPSGKLNEDTISGCGTPGFMAPELWMGDLYSYPVDIWAFAVIAYCMILGQSPWDRGNLSGHLPHQIKYGKVEFTKFEKRMYDISEDMEMLIVRGMEKDQDLRPTAGRLKAFAFFKDVDWEGLANGTLEAPWVPDVPDYQPSRRTEKKPVIKPGKLYSPSKDQVPFFAYISPRLGSHSPIIPSPTTTLCDFSSSPEALPDGAPPAAVGYPLRWSPTSASGVRFSDEDTARGSLRPISLHDPSPSVGLGFYVDREDSGSLPFLARVPGPSTEPTALIPEDVSDEGSHFSLGVDTFRAVDAPTVSPVAAEPSFSFMADLEDSQSSPFIRRNVNPHPFNIIVHTAVEVVEEAMADENCAPQSPTVYNKASHTNLDAEQEALRFLSAVHAYRNPAPFAITVNTVVEVVEEGEVVEDTPIETAGYHSQSEGASSSLPLSTSIVSPTDSSGMVDLDGFIHEPVSPVVSGPAESVLNGLKEPLPSPSLRSLAKPFSSPSVSVVSLSSLPTPSPSFLFSLSSASSIDHISFESSMQSISPSGPQSSNLVISSATFNIPCSHPIHAASSITPVTGNKVLVVAVNLFTPAKKWVRNVWNRLT